MRRHCVLRERQTCDSRQLAAGGQIDLDSGNLAHGLPLSRACRLTIRTINPGASTPLARRWEVPSYSLGIALMNKSSTAVLLVQVLLLAGCVTPRSQAPSQSVNLIYQPGVLLKDSVYAIEQGRATFCVVLGVDGTSVSNSIDASILASAGKGNVLLIRRSEHSITPGPHSLSIGCRSVSALPVLDAFNKFKVKGTVELSAAKEHTYAVRSRYEGEAAFVWIEDEASGTPVTAVLTASGQAQVSGRN